MIVCSGLQAERDRRRRQYGEGNEVYTRCWPADPQDMLGGTRGDNTADARGNYMMPNSTPPMGPLLHGNVG